MQDLEALVDGFEVPAKLHCVGDIHIHEFGKRVGDTCPVGVADKVCRLRITRPATLGARNVNIRQELHVKAYLARAVAYRTAQFAGVVGEIPSLVSTRLRVLRPGEDLAQFIVDICVGRNSGTHVDANGRGVDEFHLAYSLCLDA